MERILPGLQDSVPDRIFYTGKEELVFKEEGHVVDALSLDLSFGGAAGDIVSDGGHGVRLVVDQSVVSDLNPAEEVVHALVRVLFQVCEVGTDGLSGVLWFVGAEESGLHLVPDGEVGGGVSQGFPPDDGAVSKAEF